MIPEKSDGKLGSEFEAMYEKYYGGRFPKREIAARQTIGHIREIWAEQRVQRLLDVGAGEGSLLFELARTRLATELYAIEISGSGVDAILEKGLPTLVEVRKFDGYRIPYPDKHFDVVTAIHVLEHVEHERLFLAELSRVARMIILEVPLEHTMRVERSIRLSRPYGHINLYDSVTFRNILETTGLTVEEMRIFSNSLDYERFVFGRIKGTIKYLVRTSMLRIAPGLATKSMTYMCTARCRT